MVGGGVWAVYSPQKVDWIKLWLPPPEISDYVPGLSRRRSASDLVTVVTVL